MEEFCIIFVILLAVIGFTWVLYRLFDFFFWLKDLGDAYINKHKNK